MVQIPPLLDASLPPRVLGRAEANALGFTDSALAHLVSRRYWSRPLPHTFVTSSDIGWADQLYAALAFAGRGALLSGLAALDDLNLAGVVRPDTVLVLVPPGRQPRSTAWVRVRPSSRPMSRALLPGPPRVSVARAVADACVGRSRVDDVRALVADVVRRRLCTPEEIALEYRLGPQRGSAFLRQAIDEVGLGAWSAPEARAASLLRAARVPPFEQNIELELPGGGYVIADFLWRRLRAVLEIDSDAHHALSGAGADGTSDRHLLLETLGYSAVHRTPRTVYTDPDRFVAGIAAWLRARATEMTARAG